MDNALVVFLAGTFIAAFVTSLAGFAFGLVAAGIWLHALSPQRRQL
jgi:ABC-type phosphate transport system permease subunit